MWKPASPLAFTAAYRSSRTISQLCEEFHGSKNQVERYITFARREGLLPQNKYTRFIPPELSDPNIPIEELIARKTADFQRRDAAEKERELISIPILIDGPILIAHTGDPHVDDNGTDWPLLKQHIEIINSSPAIFATNAGDYNNNWVGRLARLYANQDTSETNAWRLVEWFINAVDWLYLVCGNHDAWNKDGSPLKWMAAHAGATFGNFGVRVKLEFPNGNHCIINSQHHFRGSSQYNKAHGPLKAALFGERDDIFTCGHLHDDGYIAQRIAGKKVHAFRVGAYKRYDDHAKGLGVEGPSSPCYATLIDPSKERGSDGFVTVYTDLEQAAEILKLLRSSRNLTP